MKCIIMAAGMGTRISRHINYKPKCLLNLKGEQTLIGRTIDLLNKSGIENISIVLGYKGKYIEEELKNKNVKFYYNHFYDVTNSIASLWFAKNELQCNEETIIMNADLFLSDELIEKILSDKENIIVYSDETKDVEIDYKLFYTKDKLLKFGKELTKEETTGEEVGIVKIQPNYLNAVYNNLEKMIANQEHSTWWEHVIYTLNEQEKINVNNISPMFWSEIDFIEDYDKIKNYINKEEK